MSKIDIYIPERVKEFEPQLRLFFDLMVYKLVVNSHKNDANPNANPADIFKMLAGEVRELREAIKSEKQENVTFEACDVANMAFLAHYHAIQKTKEEFDALRKPKGGNNDS